MLNVKFIEQDLLEVEQVTFSFTQPTEYSYFYFDTKNNLRSLTGKKGENPRHQADERTVSWVHEHYIPLAHAQQAERDHIAAKTKEKAAQDPFSVDPDRFEKSRRYNVLVTASLIADGTYESEMNGTMSRDEVKVVRAIRYEELRKTLRMPTDSEIRQAIEIITNDPDRWHFYAKAIGRNGDRYNVYRKTDDEGCHLFNVAKEGDALSKSAGGYPDLSALLSLKSAKLVSAENCEDHVRPRMNG